jgi:hypothetical protein
MTHNLTKLLFRGIHEVCRKRIDGGVSHVGYFDNAADVFKAVERDAGYEAIWLSLNPLPTLPDGFTINILQPSPNRSTKESYTRRTALLIDCDPIRTNSQKRSNSTDNEKAASLAQGKAIRNFLSDQLQWPKPILVDSGNGSKRATKPTCPPIKSPRALSAIFSQVWRLSLITSCRTSTVESLRRTELPSFQELGRERRRSPRAVRGASPPFLKCRNAK